MPRGRKDPSGLPGNQTNVMKVPGSGQSRQVPLSRLLPISSSMATFYPESHFSIPLSLPLSHFQGCCPRGPFGIPALCLYRTLNSTSSSLSESLVQYNFYSLSVMALQHDNPSSSPRSSSGIEESLKGTPNTRLTTISPEGKKTQTTSFLHVLPFSNSAATSPVTMGAGDKKFGPGVEQERDPFVTPRHRISTRLSPTASAFSPFTNVNSLGEASKSNPVATALSTELGLSRYLLVASDTHLEAEEVSIWLNDLNMHGRRFHGHRSIDTENGKVYVHFRDIRDACSTLATTLTSRKSWKVEYCGALCRDRQNPGSETESPALNTGQIFLVATISPSISLDVGQIFDIAQNFLHSYGRLFAFIKIPNPSKTPSFRAIAEFCDISHATKVIANCAHVTTPEGVHLVISPYENNSNFVLSPKPTQNVTGANTQNNSQHQHLHIGSASRSVVPVEGRVSHPFTMYPLMVQSPFVANVPYILDSLPPGSSQGSVSPITTLAPSYPVLGPLYHAPPSPALTVQSSYSPSRAVAGFFRSDGRRQNAARVTRSPYNNSTNHHNYVDINRIRDGIDVRTTIMLRNIPNKVDQAMLKRIIDESSWGKYDFMYLRIDFANDCNVGYAFINFVDPLDIIDFVEARGNQRWNCFKSDKIAEISYATIQGKDCLVQKFRNSSVMLEAPHYRPKLYFTCNGPCPELAGQEEPFPDPDNQSKMKRSCENAEHVGLFTPNAGQHYRDEQRRRRSQYDRGTRLAALEEYDYEAAIQNMYTITPH